jgi:hypothetical protein
MVGFGHGCAIGLGAEGEVARAEARGGDRVGGVGECVRELEVGVEVRDAPECSACAASASAASAA